MWQIALGAKSDLLSPDSSYQGIVLLESLDASGKPLGSVSLVELFKQRNWQAVSKRVEMPAGVATARFRAELRKTSGKFWIDELSAAYVSAAPRKDKRIAAILFATAQMGNMLFPEDKRSVGVTVRASKPLKDNQRELSYVVRDYWGAEQIAPGKTALTKSGKKGNWFEYDTSLDLSAAPLEVGRYYEIHAYVPQENDLPFHNYTSLAILPEALTKHYKPEEIPFTSRDWDNRIGEYFTLSDRIGIRICGIWGGWSADPPYKPDAPSIQFCEKLQMGVLTGVPTHAIQEHSPGYQKYDEKALRQGVRNWLEKFGKVRPTIISLGNEPHGDDARVQESIKAYAIVYDEVKKIDPTRHRAGHLLRAGGAVLQVRLPGLLRRLRLPHLRELCRRAAGDRPLSRAVQEVRRRQAGLVDRAGTECPGHDAAGGGGGDGQEVRRLLRGRRGQHVLVRPAVSRPGGHGRRQQRLGLQRLRLPLLALCPEAGRRGVLQHGQRHLHQEVRGARSSTPAGPAPICSATATAGASRSCGQTRAARTWACRCPAWTRCKSSASTAGGPK